MSSELDINRASCSASQEYGADTICQGRG